MSQGVSDRCNIVVSGGRARGFAASFHPLLKLVTVNPAYSACADCYKYNDKGNGVFQDSTDSTSNHGLKSPFIFLPEFSHQIINRKYVQERRATGGKVGPGKMEKPMSEHLNTKPDA